MISRGIIMAKREGSFFRASSCEYPSVGLKHLGQGLPAELQGAPCLVRHPRPRERNESEKIFSSLCISFLPHGLGGGVTWESGKNSTHTHSLTRRMPWKAVRAIASCSRSRQHEEWRPLLRKADWYADLHVRLPTTAVSALVPTQTDSLE